VSDFAAPTPPIDILRDLALALAARAGLVQGAGGNVSLKDARHMWIKASGTRFSDARTADIFVEIDLAGARETVLVSEDLAHLVLGGPEGLRPSIETAIHALLPQRVVAHVHSVGAIAAAIDVRAAEIAAELVDLGRVVHVPYAKPGIQLAQAISAAVDVRSAQGPILVLLGNHGLIVAADDVEDVIHIIHEVENRWAPPLAASQARQDSGEWWEVLPPGSIDAVVARLAAAGPYTPDQAVFLGARPFHDERAEEADVDPSTLLRVTTEGALLARRSVSADALEIAVSIIDVLHGVREGAEVRQLEEAQIAELIDWDAEKWRRQLER